MEEQYEKKDPNVDLFNHLGKSNIITSHEKRFILVKVKKFLLLNNFSTVLINAFAMCILFRGVD